MLKRTRSVLILALICTLSLCVFALSACSHSDNPSNSATPIPGVSATPSPSVSVAPSPSASATPSPSASATPRPSVPTTPGTGGSSSGGSGVLCANGAHAFGEFIVQVEPNCYRAGAEYRVCSRCNYRDYRDVAKTSEHKIVSIPEVKATCSSNGLTEGKRCEVCGEVFVMQQSIERLPHTEEVIVLRERGST